MKTRLRGFYNLTTQQYPLWEELPESYSDNAIFAYRQKIYEYVFMRYKEVA